MNSSDIKAEQRRGGGQGPRAVLLLALATCIPAIAIIAYLYTDKVELPLLILGTILAGLGTVALLGWLAGVFGFQSLSGNSSFYDSIVDATGDAAVITDAKGRAIYSNASFLKLASQSGASRLVGFENLFAGYVDFAEPIYQLGQAAKSGETMRRDVRVAAGSSAPGASDTMAKWLRLTVSPLQGDSQAGKTLWRLMDITADRLHQENAFARLQFIITYLDNAPAGFFSTLPDGKVDYVNATLAGWLGIDLVEAQGGAYTLVKLVGDDTAQQLSALAPVKGGAQVETFNVILRARDGSNIPVSIVHRADFDQAGAALPSRSMVLKRAEDQHSVATGAESLRHLEPLIPIGFATLDSTGKILSANPSFLDMSASMKLKGSLLESISKLQSEKVQLAMEQAFGHRGKRVEADVVLESAQPKAVRFSFAANPAQSDQLMVFALDMTESKTLEVQLAQSQKMQAVGQLASGIAHDFNNVLTPIIGFADLLLAKMRPADPSFNDIMNIKQNANRAANLVRQLLAFSRKQTMQPKLHSLTEAMSDLGNLLGRVLGEKIDLEIVHSRDLGHVLVDIHQFEQVIINLAVNARDAMTNGGTLKVRTWNATVEAEGPQHKLPAGDYVVCTVTDSGTGIPADIVEKIWEPFFSTKEVGKGTGLGLSMVYGIIKQTGGYIFCDSEVGKGTTFTIYLPRQEPPAAAAVSTAEGAKAAEPARADFTGRGRILVVEDEDSVRAFAMRALQSRGYTVVEAESGERGLEKILEDKDGFELILSDVVMPEMDGPTMLSEIRKRGINTKFIFMSGYAEDAFERNLENPGDFGFLQKPFSLKQLVEKVKEAIA
jgi:two-component system, cell cycle sensor histidine kinase and response regulator CckA